MRFTIVASLLLLSACTIREDTFASRNDGGIDGLALTVPEAPINPAIADDTAGCRGAFARGTSQIQDLRDGVRDPFCD